MSRTTWVVVALVAGVALAATALWIVNARDDAEFDIAAIVANASSESARTSTVSGIIRGTTIDYMEPWSAVLEVKTGDGKTVNVAVNAHTDLEVSDRAQRMPNTEPSGPFPWRVSGLRLEAAVKPVKAGPFGLQRQLVATDARIVHP